MNYPRPSWPYLPPPSPPHSTEIEHRLTVIETIQHERLLVNEERRQKIDADLHSILSRLNWYERAILAMGGVLQILAQDKYPAIAAALKRVLAP